MGCKLGKWQENYKDFNEQEVFILLKTDKNSTTEQWDKRVLNWNLALYILFLLSTQENNAEDEERDRLMLLR